MYLPIQAQPVNRSVSTAASTGTVNASAVCNCPCCQLVNGSVICC